MIKARHINFIVIKYLRQSSVSDRVKLFEKMLAWCHQVGGTKKLKNHVTVPHNAIDVDDDSRKKVTLKPVLYI